MVRMHQQGVEGVPRRSEFSVDVLSATLAFKADPYTEVDLRWLICLLVILR